MSAEESPADIPGMPLKRGIVYVLTNRAMPDFVKVGRTAGDSAKDVLDRMKNLDNTSVPLPFDCEYAVVVNDFEVVERTLLTAFEDRRVRNREFLQEVAPHRVKAILKLVEITDVTPTGESGPQVEADKSHASRFRFSLAGVPIGSTLEWADDPRITCLVEGDTHVLHEGKRTTISGLARELKGWSAAQGSRYWLYEGKTLQEWREQIELGESGPPSQLDGDEAGGVAEPQE